MAGEAGHSPESQERRGGLPAGRGVALFGLPAIWLRDNCPCSQCRDPTTGERLVSITDVPADVSISWAHRSGDRIEVVFAPDGHQAAFDARWLGQFGTVDTGPPVPGAAQRTSQLPDNEDIRTEDAKRLWAAADIAAAFPQGSWPLFQSDRAHRQACLESVLRSGFLVLRDVPEEAGTVLTVARSFGSVRETEHGPTVDMQISGRPSAQVFTSQYLAPRTGQAFRDPVPTLQFTHCLHQAPQGGASVLVDGFHAAAALRAERPHAFEVLARTDVTFAFADARSDLRATRPVIGTDAHGRIREIRIDPGRMQPLRMPPAQVVEFYDAYRAFAEVIGGPKQSVTFRLRPGDCLVHDNTRMLIGRTAFTASVQRRHLQMCWAELDGLASALALLRRVRHNGQSRA